MEPKELVARLVYIFRVAGGKLAGAVVAVEDNLARMRQLGLIDGD
jgi:hypothetical protein